MATRWLPDLAAMARFHVSKPKSDAPRSSSAVVAPSLQQGDNDQFASSNPLIPRVIRRSAPPDEPVSDPPSPVEAAPPAVPAPEAADNVTPPPLLDLREIEAAKRVQQRLIELGFLAGAADGTWGARSRRALQDFKAAHGLGDDDTWDEATQEQMLASPDAHASAPDLAFIGGWGTDAAECRHSPLTITARRAEAGGGTCDFYSTQREGSNIWRLQARCSNESERWNANIHLSLSGRKLTWSSERGTAIYVRCLR